MHAELKGEGKDAAGAAEPDDTPLAADAQIDALTDDDYFRKNAEAGLCPCDPPQPPPCMALR
jgi:hypothetical protein